jgi:NAD(P)H-hydrate epimerase
VQRSRIRTVRSFAQEYGVFLALKGAKTIIAEPSGQLFVNPTGNTGLAKGGSGDVLTGLIAGFAAQGLSLFDAATCGVYIHGLAADLAAQDIGERAMTPSDVISYISEAFHSIEH